MTGKHIELFLVDGEAGGLRTADVSGWTGHLLAGPRSDLKCLLDRPEASGNGAYVLLGDDPDCVENLRCYIGKTESFTNRFRDHDRKKDWWDRAVLITSRDASFNEGHWSEVESRLLEIAAAAERCTLDDNKQTPQPRRLSEAQKSDVEDFLVQLRTILPVLGVNILRTSNARSIAEETPAPAVEHSPIFTLSVPRRGITARGEVVGDEFLLLEGSVISPRWTGRASSEATQRSYAAMSARHAKLVADGSLQVHGDTAVVTRDIPFGSPSLAGAIATGRACNGRTAWIWDGGTYADWENRGLGDAAPEVSSPAPDEEDA
ncbi:methionine sulfoxide reductase [Actinomyces radicidentis]|uniref:Methionine sulfoxide reductase n=1 Tax=Actinomyces radicidentis TaxID=111015 RepID=A0A109W2V0_ACTRD|nr:GIY-YIG nuclease family protein [Actinomyces radicidentis]AMD87723.1 methionine sulfoxide reductase [Actinomyces radicidentis]